MANHNKNWKSFKNELTIPNIIISVDNNEWFYGKSENRTNVLKRKLLDREVSTEEIVSERYAKAINELLSFMSCYERDTAKRKKRQFFVDEDLFLKY